MGKVIETDIAVTGAGLAGLSAAYRIAKNTDLKVDIFEKRPHQGGAVSNCPMGVMTVPPENLMKALEVTAEFTNHTGDLGVARTWFEYSALLPDLILNELGIEKESYVKSDVDTYGKQRGYGIGFPNGQHVGDYFFMKGHGKGHAAALINLKYRRKLEAMGAAFHFRTPIDEIIREKGKIVGAVAHEIEGGAQIQIKCKALIVTSGGFSGNKKMLKEELGLTYTDRHCIEGGDVRFIHFPNGQLTGDGQRAVWKIGGFKGGMTVTGPCDVNGPGEAGRNVPWLAKNQIRVLQEQPVLWVNEFGERFMNEEMSNQHMAIAGYISNFPKNCCYIIFDEDTVKRWGKRGVEEGYVYFIFRGKAIHDVASQMDAMITEGSTHVCHADTIREVCEKMGINEKGLRKTLEEYNSYCDRGEDLEFGKNPRYLRPVREESGHIYAMRVVLGGYMTMGGIRVNRRCEVLDTEKYPIPGLYSAGDIISGSIFGDPPRNGTGTLSQAVSTGMAAADYAADYVKEDCHEN
ncbi:MAG: FAD-dependent oxidoreductase [Lachnospiraceae bacterium]|nr:FAD-dependent oxidoreductase [Lachnospiraceae bacterium]